MAEPDFIEKAIEDSSAPFKLKPLMILNDVCATEAPPVVTSQQQDWAQTINEA